MTLAGFSFLLHFTAWRAVAKAYWKSAEARRVHVTLVAAALVSPSFLLSQAFMPIAKPLRYALFNVVSVATTTGYQTPITTSGGFRAVSDAVSIRFATCAGSTGGGSK